MRKNYAAASGRFLISDVARAKSGFCTFPTEFRIDRHLPIFSKLLISHLARQKSVGCFHAGHGRGWSQRTFRDIEYLEIPVVETACRYKINHQVRRRDTRRHFWYGNLILRWERLVGTACSIVILLDVIRQCCCHWSMNEAPIISSPAAWTGKEIAIILTWQGIGLYFSSTLVDTHGGGNKIDLFVWNRNFCEKRRIPCFFITHARISSLLRITAPTVWVRISKSDIVHSNCIQLSWNFNVRIICAY